MGVSKRSNLKDTLPESCMSMTALRRRIPSCKLHRNALDSGFISLQKGPLLVDKPGTSLPQRAALGRQPAVHAA